MKNVKNRICFLVFLVLLSITKVNALECDNHTKVELNKLAGNVSANYEFNYDESYTRFNINVFNLSEGLKAEISNNRSSDIITVNYSDTNNGFYTFVESDTDNIIKYTIKIYGVKDGCNYISKTLSIVKPKFNNYAKLDNCKIEGMQDYVYCKEWITSEINIKESTVLKSISKKVEELNNIPEDKCYSCKLSEDAISKKNNTKQEKINTLIKLGLIIVAVIAGIVIFAIKSRKDYELLDEK